MPKSKAPLLVEPPPDLSPLLNGTQVCDALGISSRTLDRLIADDELPEPVSRQRSGSTTFGTPAPGSSWSPAYTRRR